jgi:phosphoribosylformimino-5-aminoimidazole carboxamide ribotide isomerase
LAAPFTLYPAVDIRNGRCVRLLQGEDSQATGYGDPVERARRWVDQGAQWLHVVDLDGAFTGRSANGPALAAICALGVPVQTGGGIRSLADIAARFALGAARVIVGTLALERPDLVRAACQAYPGQIACGIDARGGRAATLGWTQGTETDALELAQSLRAAGAACVIYSDIGRDGTLQGPNLPETQRLCQAAGLPVIGSGGVAALDDLRRLRQAGCQGAIIGKALYEGAFTLRAALDISAKENKP